MAKDFGAFVADAVSPPPIDVFGPLNYIPTDRQAVFHDASRNRIDAILYGGAAGGGKSCAFLMDAIWFALNFPGIKIGCFRRTYPELEESFLAELGKRDYAKAVGGRWNQTNKMLKFSNGSVINFSYAETLVDASRIQGGEYQILYIDEAGLMDPRVIQHLAERLRSADKLIPVIGLRLASNPGGMGHRYLKDRFIKPTRNGRLKSIIESIEGTKFTRTIAFIPATADDNPHLDAGYDAVLNSIPDPQRRKAMRDGDWDAMVGQFFEQWSHARHVVPFFVIPMEWQRYAGIDYGTRDPFACVWVAPDNDGRLWAYRELYATGLYPESQAKLILEMEAQAGEYEVVRVADPSMWGNRGTPLSIADEYGLAGCGIGKADNDRPSGWARVHHYLNDGPACLYHKNMGWTTCPMLHVFEETCPAFIDTIPSLPHSITKPDDADTHAEDHMADALRYVCMEVGTYAGPVFYEDPNSRLGLPLGLTPAPSPVEKPKDDALPMIGGFVLGDDWA